MAHAERLERQYRAKANRSCTEHDDLVSGLGFAAVGAVAGDGHRFVEGGDLERDVIGDDLQTGSPDGVFDQQEIGEGTGRPAVADDAARRDHRVDDDVVTDRDVGDVGADVDDFTGGFVP